MLLCLAGCKIDGGSGGGSANLDSPREAVVYTSPFTGESMLLTNDTGLTDPFDNDTNGDQTPGAVPAPVPEPGTMALLSLGLVGYALMRTRNKRK
jgi:hypothetical protein